MMFWPGECLVVCCDGFEMGKLDFLTLQCTLNEYNSFDFEAKIMGFIVLESLFYALSL